MNSAVWRTCLHIEGKGLALDDQADAHRVPDGDSGGAARLAARPRKLMRVPPPSHGGDAHRGYGGLSLPHVSALFSIT